MEKAINLVDIYAELKKIEEKMITKEELDQAMETVAVLSNVDTMAQIEASEKDITAGKVKEINSVADL